MADLIPMLAAAGGAGGEVDPNFNQTTLLLHGDGTNGAQNNTFLDSSTNNFTITRNGNTTQGTFSPFSAPDGRWSNYFNGVTASQEALTATQTAIGTGNFTYEFWFNISSNGSNQNLIDNASGILFFYNNSTGTIVFYNRIDDTSISSGVISLNEWHHCAGVREGTGSNQTKLYIDGVLQNSGTFSSDLTGTGLVIGARYAVSGGSWFGAKGYISNFRISDSARYTSAFTPSTTPLTADGNTLILTCQSNRFVDTDSTPLTITVVGSPKVTPFSPFAPTAAYSASVNGGSGYFDGSGDYLDANSTLKDLGTGDFCIEFWVYTAATDAIVVDTRSDTNVGWMIYIDTTIRFYHAGSSRVTGSIQLNAWNHVAVTRSSGTLRLFVNGAQADSTTYTANLSDGDDFRIASKTNANSTVTDLNGYLSSFRIVAGSAVYTSAFTPPTAPLTAIANTSLLCNFTNAGIFDNTGKNNLETVGNAQIDTTTKKYGTGSMEFDGTGDYLLLQDNENFIFGTGDFTIEFWVYSGELTTSTIDPNFIDFRPASTNGVYPSIFYDASASNLVFYVSTANRIDGGALSENTWYHIAVARAGTSTKMFVNGLQVGSTYTDTNNYLCGTNRPVIAAQGFNLTNVDRQLNGFIDDLRITKGVARYTSNFTVPTKAFPDL